MAFGEIGLDYHYDFSPREIQREVFIEQLKLARELDLPITIHTREAWDDTMSILREHWYRRRASCTVSPAIRRRRRKLSTWVSISATAAS